MTLPIHTFVVIFILRFQFAFFASNVFFHFSALCKPGYFPIHLQIVLILVLQFSALRWPQNRKETTSIILCLLRAWSKHDFPQTQISFEGLETSTLGGEEQLKRHLSVSFQIVPGLDFMIGGKDTCDVRKILPVKFFHTFSNPGYSLPFSESTLLSGWLNR